MKKISIVLAVSIIFMVSCTGDMNKNSFEVMITNQSKLTLNDQYVELDLNKVAINNPVSGLNFLVKVNGVEVPSQKIGDEKLGFITDFKPSEEKTVVVEYGKDIPAKEFESRTYAEISMKVDYEKIDGKYTGGQFKNFQKVIVPKDHIDHNALFRYEGPGWESDKVGYRMYIDWRNRTDIFGKKTDKLVLKDVGITDIEAKEDSYHLMQEWGKDIFKVGSSFGIGSFGMMSNDGPVMVSERDSVVVEITENGPVKSTVKVEYFGWKVGENIYDLQTDISITAGSRLTEINLNATNNPENFVTGLAKHKGTEYKEIINEDGWSSISVYGVQTIADYGQPDEPVDKLGIVVFFDNRQLIEKLETEDSYTVVLKPVQGKMKYYFAAAWEQEPGGIKSKEEFYNYLNSIIESLNSPITLKY